MFLTAQPSLPGFKSQFLSYNDNNKAEPPQGCGISSGLAPRCGCSSPWEDSSPVAMSMNPGSWAVCWQRSSWGSLGAVCSVCKAFPTSRLEDPGVVGTLVLLFPSPTLQVSRRDWCCMGLILLFQFIPQSFSFPWIQQKWCLEADLQLLLHLKP